MEDMNKIRMTRQRQVILNELRKVTSHPTAEQLFRMVRKRIPDISLATVYRNLELMTDAGLILKLEAGGGKWRFDGNPANHYHVRCIECGRVDDIMGMPVLPLNERAVPLTSFEIQDHRLEFIGICPDCKRKENMQVEV